MRARFVVPFALCLTALAATSHAGTLPVPTVEYSADRTIETEAGTMTGKVYSARDKERSETNMRGMQTVMILRRDKQLGYMLMPAQKMYQQMDFAKAQQQSGGQPADQVEITEVGSDTIEGQPTTKYKLIMKDGSAGGFMWITKDGIAVKLDAISKENGKKTRFTMTLSNLQIGTVDPSVFEVPAGYSAMPSFGGMMGGHGGVKLPGFGR